MAPYDKKPLNISELEKRLYFDASLPAIAGQVLWLDAADDTTILDADGDNAATGTGGAGDGFDGSVATWQDKSGVGVDVTATGTERPQYGVDTQNSNGVITFDGSNDRLISNQTVGGDDMTMFIVYNRTTDTGRDAVFELGSNSTTRNGVFLFNNDTVSYYSSGNFTANSGTYAQGNYHLSSFVHDQTSIQGWMNGNSVLNTTTNTRGSTTSVTVGDDVTSGDEMTGTVAEILVYDRDLTTQERHDIENYLANKWGLIITNATPTVVNNSGTVDEGATLTFNTGHLSGTDTDNQDENLTFTVTSLASNGTLRINGVDANINDTFSQQDIIDGNITYEHDDSETTSDNFGFSLTDGLDTLTGQTFSFTINPVVDSANIDAIPNQVFHFDATDIDADGDTADQPGDESQVGTWNDGSGNNFNGSQGSGGSQPLYDADAFGGRGGIKFDGSNDYFNVGNDALINTGTYSEKSFAIVFETSGDVSGTQILYEQGGGSNGYNIAIVNGDVYAYVWGESYWPSGDRTKAINLGTVSTNESYYLIAVHDGTDADINNNTFSASLNGGAFQTLSRVDPLGGHSGGISIGRSGDSQSPVTHGNIGAGSYFEGNIGEFYSWNHALDTTESADVSTYLNNKWINTPPVLATNLTLNTIQGGVDTIDNTILQTTDVDIIDTPDQLVYTITGDVSNGTLYRFGTALGLNDTFTQEDIDNNIIKYSHDNSATTTDSFTFNVTDGDVVLSSNTFNINVAAQPPSDPFLTQNLALNINEGASSNITTALLDATDNDTIDANITYQITTDFTFGTLYRNAVALNATDTFTQQDIIDGLISYTHDGTENFTDSFAFTLFDGTTTTAAENFSVIINPVNDQTPTAIGLTNNSVNENSATGTLIGTLSATDADLPGDTFTYSIFSDPDSKFQINGDRLELAAGVNHEANGSHAVTIQVNDGVNTYNQLFNIIINDVNENPTSLTINNNSVAENTTAGTLIGTFSATDPDLPGDTFIYSIISDPDSKFQISGNRLEVMGNLDFETSSSHSVTVRVSDGNGGTRNQVFSINVTNVNDIPIAIADETSVAQGGVITITTDLLSATDQDNVDNNLIFEITSLPSDGILRLNGTALNPTDTFTQQDIINGNITYTHDGTSTNSTDGFSFTVTDGTLTTAVETATFNLIIQQSNLNTGTVAEGNQLTVQNTDLEFTASWYDTSWLYRQEITIDNTMVDGDLVDFSLLINESGLGADFWSNVKTDGSDIVITSSDGLTKLDRELVTIDTIGQTMQLYTRTDLSSSTDTTLYIYYGNAAAAETNDATTWRSEFTGVWHFDDDFNDGDVADSSQAGNHGFTRGGFNSGNQVAGVTGQAGDFNNAEYLALNYSYSGNNTLDQVSVSAWVNTTVNTASLSANWAIIDFDRSEFFDVYVHGDGRVGFSTAGNAISINDFYSNGTTVNDGNWHQVTAVYDGTDKILYVDGNEVARLTNVYGGADLGKSTRFGFIGDGSEATSFDGGRNNAYYDGQFDNIHLYEGALSGDWISAEFRNHNNPATFYAMSSQQQFGDNATYTLTNNVTNGILYVDANGNNIVDGGEAVNVSSTFTQADINNGDLKYVHDGGETTSDSFDFYVSDNGVSTDVRTMPLTVTPVNDVPTDVSLSTTNASEDIKVGGTIASLSSTDVDLPGDSFTYTILSDPDNRFSIVGNELRVGNKLDFETITSHSVTIQTNDNNGGTFSRIFTINVLDADEPDGLSRFLENLGDTQVILSRADRPSISQGISSDGNFINDGGSPVISAFVDGDAASQTAAFYGDDVKNQVLRENTTFEIQKMVKDGNDTNAQPSNIDQRNNISGTNNVDAQNTINPNVDSLEINTSIDLDKNSEEKRNLRDILNAIEIEDNQDNDDEDKSGENSDGSNNELSKIVDNQNLYDQFEETLTYHEKRLNTLKEALMGN